MELTLAATRREAADVVSYLFKSQAPLAWRAGQFLRYSLPHPDPDARKTTRYFTIASALFEGFAMLTTRFAGERGSSFKRALRQLAAGAVVSAGQPAGDFVVDDPAADHVLIAGGIGITPYRAILLDLDHRGVSIRARLLYANPTPELVYRSELDTLARKHPGLRVHYVVSPDRITEESIRAAAAELQQPIYYLSGPEPMVEAFEGVLTGMGVPDARLKRDYFPGYDWP